jgi:hypothetical protein
MRWTKKKVLVALAGGVATLLIANEVSDGALFGAAVPEGDYPFPFNDGRWLRPGQSNGGLAHVPKGARGKLPLVVWLHGNNEDGVLHRGVGAPGNDLRKMVPAPYVVAAPSHTLNAKGASLFAGFNLEDFVDAVEKAIGAPIDRSEIVVVGHSGAGCASSAGIYGNFGSIKPKQVIALDTCLDPAFAGLLASIAARGSKVSVYYQTRSWSRDFAGFTRAFGGRGTVENVNVPGGGNPHEDIVPVVIQKVFGSPSIA